MSEEPVETPPTLSTDESDVPPRQSKRKPPATRKVGGKTVSAKSGKRVGRPPKKVVNIETTVTQSMESIGAMMMMAGVARGSEKLAYDGRVFQAKAGDVGRMVDDLAKENPALKKTLERMFQGSSWGKVGFTVLGVAAPIAVNHDILPVVAAAPFFTSELPPPSPSEPRKPKPKPKPKPGRRPVPGEPPRGEGSAASGLPDAP